MTFEEFLADWVGEEEIATEDVLASFLPLVREVVEAHEAGFVAPLEGLGALQVERSRIWFEEARRLALRDERGDVARVERASRSAVEVLSEARRTVDVSEGEEHLVRAEIGERGEPVVRPVYLPGYVAWEHEVGHHDPLTDVFSLGLILASLALQQNLNEPAALAAFVTHRRNLFALRPDLHPALAQAIVRMTELERHRRAQDLPALLASLESYRDQTVSFDVDLARIPGFRTRDRKTRQQVVLTRLRDRLFDLSRRNPLLHFRPTMQSVNLTQASVPLLLDIRNVREEQIWTWNERLHEQIVLGDAISLNKHLNFLEALYLPSLFERILAEARRDANELGFVQLRLVLAFLTWANLKEKPAERYVSPLVLLPVRLIKQKGIRDTFLLEPLTSEAEINPALRHQLKQLYGIELPELLDLAETSLEALFELLTAQIRASEPAVTLSLLDRPRIDLIHEKARRRLDQYRKSARVSGRGVRHHGDLDYSYDPANYHPLGIKLFAAKVRTPSSHLREIVEERPRPRSFAVDPGPGPRTVEVERSLFQLREAVEENPYLWNFDLCNLTLANFRYRRMSLVRDYESLLESDAKSAAFEATFSLAPRPAGDGPRAALPLDERFDVVPCDPTQGTAIALARRGQCYIVQGPPGTGKSQTITNLIADFAAQGRRVLFVCEKRAALDVVFARLRKCGLDPLCCLIHDSQADKKDFIFDLKRTYEGLLEADVRPAPSSAAPAASGRAAALARVKQDLAPFKAFAGAMESPLLETDLTVRRFLDRSIELAPERPPLPPEEAERLPSYDQWWSHAEPLARLEQALDDLMPGGVLARHPFRRLSPELTEVERPIERVTSGTAGALAALDSLVEVLARTDVPAEAWSTLGQVRRLLAYARLAEPLAAHDNLRLLEPRSERSRRFAAEVRKIETAEKRLEKAARPAHGSWLRKLSPAELEVALPQVRQWEGKLLSWLSPGWWKLRKGLKESYHFRSGQAVQPTWLQLLTALEKEHEARDALAATVEEARAAFGMDGESGNEGSLEDLRRAVTELRDEVPRLPAWLRRVHAALLESPDPEATEAVIELLLAAEEPAVRLETGLDRFLVDFDDLPLDELRQDLAAIRRDARQVPHFLGVLGELVALPAAVAAALRRLPFGFREIESAVAGRTWEELLRGDRQLERFDGLARRRLVDRLETSYDTWLGANAGEIRQRVRQRFLDNIRLSGLPASQLDREQREWKRRYAQGRRTLEHEFGKSLRFRSIRELLEGDSALVIQDLKPIWLMSPLSVSDTFRLAPDVVDVVIFDEASQVPLEESIPALFRAAQVIVVGDPMQLPPTDFFTARAPVSDDEEEDLFVTEDGRRMSYDLDSDSFLNHAARNLPSTLLGWHYRSRSELLIHFSNQSFYDGRLLTVPDRQSAGGGDDPESAAPEASGIDLLLRRPVSFHLLREGVYDNRRNRAEAELIAGLVRDLLKRRLRLSLGVIAFSEAQQGEIEAALQRLAQDDEEFRTLYEEELQREEDGQFVGLLVKNLENVQGDERDVVILSICYGYGPNGRMLMNFGPINKSGGEKRLNVAFSRAKQHMAVVSSIEHGAITNDYNDGASCLKSFLRYAQAVSQGDLRAAERSLSGVARGRAEAQEEAREEGIRQQLAKALTERGYEVELGVGQSHFRVDLAVRQPGEREYRLGILIDAAERYEQVETLEREMLRPRLLKDFGWRVTQVLGKDWYGDPEGEVERILGLLAGEEEEEVEEIEEEDVEVAEVETVTVLDDEPESLPEEELERDEDAEASRLLRRPGSRYFELRDDRSAKFWEITLEGEKHTVRYGRIGADGQNLTRYFDDAAAARTDAERLIREKTRKGYREV